MQEQMTSNKNNKAENQVQSTKASEKCWQKVIIGMADWYEQVSA